MVNKIVDLPQIGKVELVKRRGSKHLRLTFKTNGMPRVSLPTWVPYVAAIRFAIQHQAWIAKHRPQPTKLLTHGHAIGKSGQLLMQPGNYQRVTTTIRGQQAIVRLPYEATVTDEAVQQAAHRVVERYLTTECEELLIPRLAQHAQYYNFRYRSLSFKKLRSRWGSCSSQKDIIINIYLLQLPWPLVDYVLLHELTHTEHLDHSPAFWARMRELIPDLPTRRKQIHTHRPVSVIT